MRRLIITPSSMPLCRRLDHCWSSSGRRSCRWCTREGSRRSLYSSAVTLNELRGHDSDHAPFAARRVTGPGRA